MKKWPQNPLRFLPGHYGQDLPSSWRQSISSDGKWEIRFHWRRNFYPRDPAGSWEQRTQTEIWECLFQSPQLMSGCPVKKHSIRDDIVNVRCLKITEKVSFNIAFATFWVDKSWLKMPKIVYVGEFLKNWSLRSNSVTRHVSFKIGQKLVENAKIEKFKWDILSIFQTWCRRQ